MKKIIVSIFILIFVGLVIFITKRVNIPNDITSQINYREKLYLVGTKQQIRDYLEKQDSKIHYADLWSLIDRNRNDILEMILKEYNINPNIGVKFHADTPLLHASENLKPKSVEVLVKYGADVNYINEWGKTALVLASNSLENLSMHGLTPDGNERAFKIIKLLVESGANINTVGRYGETAIKGAISDKDLKRVKYLVDNGGDIKHIDSDGANYMFYCDSLECIEYLITKGVNINDKASDGENILLAFVKTSWIKLDVITGIIDLGIDVCHKDNNGDTVINHAETRDTNPHNKKDNPEFYYKKLEENKASETYKYLEKEYNIRCLDKSN